MTWEKKINSPQLSNATSYCAKITGKASGAWLRPNNLWCYWCLLLTLVVVFPLIIACCPYAECLSAIAALCSAGSMVALFFYSLVIEKQSGEFTNTKYWHRSPAYLKIRRKRVWYFFALSQFLVYAYLWYVSNNVATTNTENPALIAQGIALFMWAIMIWIAFCFVVTLLARNILKLKWIDSLLRNKATPYHIKDMFYLRSGRLDIHPQQWLHKEDFSKACMRKALQTCFFSKDKTLLAETVPFKFVVVFLGPIFVSYLVLLSLYVSPDITATSLKSYLTLSAITWVATSFTFFCHARDQVWSDCINNKTKIQFQMPFLKMVSQREWLSLTKNTLGVNGWKILSFLMLSLLPHIWSLSRAVSN